MPFAGFKTRKDASPLIPPVSSEPSGRSTNTSSPRPGYQPDAYDRRSPAPPTSRSASSNYADSGYATSRYNTSTTGNSYPTRDQDDSDRQRSELFAGLDRNRGPDRSRFMDGPDSGRREPPPGEENEEDVEGIKQQSRFLKQDSAQSTRNALRMAREAEETAMNTLNKLGDQSEKFANIERHLDVSKGHAHRAADRTDELKQLNRSIFRPVIVFNKDQKRAAQEAKVQQRHDEQRSERERAMMEVRETHNRLRGATTLDDDDDEGIGAGMGRRRTAEQLNQRKEQRKKYQFEATASDDELEDEIDDNLDEIMNMTKRLKNLGTAMGNELDSQNGRLEGISRKTNTVDNMLVKNTNKLKRY